MLGVGKGEIEIPENSFIPAVRTIPWDKFRSLGQYTDKFSYEIVVDVEIKNLKTLLFNLFKLISFERNNIMLINK